MISQSSSSTIGVVDVGSNSVKAWVVEIYPDSFTKLLDVRYPLRLGRGTFSAGEILKQDSEALVAIFQNLSKNFQMHKVSSIRAVGTSAMREACNSRESVQQVIAQTGISIDIITGIDEARLVASSALAGLTNSGPALILDIGGGSTEVILTDAEGKVSHVESMPLGAVRLAEKMGMPAIYTEEIIVLLRQHIQATLNSLALPASSRYQTVIGTGGTIKALIDMRQFWSDVPAEGTTLPRHFLNHAINAMQDKTISHMTAEFDLDEKRAQILMAGAVVLSEVMNRYNVEHLVMAECGVREGLILQEMQKLAAH